MTITVVAYHSSFHEEGIIISPLYYEETGSERFSDVTKITYLIQWENSYDHFPQSYLSSLIAWLRKVSLRQ